MVTHEAHIRGLEERLEDLRAKLQERADHRREIVDQRLQEALKPKSDTHPKFPHDRKMGPKGMPWPGMMPMKPPQKKGEGD